MKRILLIVLIIIVTSACNTQQTQGAPTVVVEPGSTQPSVNLPQTENEVPRVTIEESRAALESGAAIVVDVRDPSQYEERHVAGAISIWLDDIEANPASVNLDKDQWIITYCA